MSYRVAVIWAGSFFTDSIVEGMCKAGRLFDGTTFVLVDIDAARLRLSLRRNREHVKKLGMTPRLTSLRAERNRKRRQEKRSEADRARHETRARAEFYNVPFPRDGNHPHYDEKPTQVMEAFATNAPLYMTAINIPNRGAIENLPDDAIVDVPAVATGGEVRGVRVGALPPFAMELCRRQITDAFLEYYREDVPQFWR